MSSWSFSMPIVRFWSVATVFAFANDLLSVLFSCFSQASATTTRISKTISVYIWPPAYSATIPERGGSQALDTSRH